MKELIHKGEVEHYTTEERVITNSSNENCDNKLLEKKLFYKITIISKN